MKRLIITLALLLLAISTQRADADSGNPYCSDHGYEQITINGYNVTQGFLAYGENGFWVNIYDVDLCPPLFFPCAAKLVSESRGMNAIVWRSAPDDACPHDYDPPSIFAEATRFDCNPNSTASGVSYIDVCYDDEVNPIDWWTFWIPFVSDMLYSERDISGIENTPYPGPYPGAE